MIANSARFIGASFGVATFAAFAVVADARSQSVGVDQGVFPSVTVASILGREFTTTAGDKGRIIDVLADENGQVRASVVELGGFLGIGTRKVAVEWSAIRFVPQVDQQAVRIDIEPEKLRSAPEYKPNAPTFVVQSE